MAASVAPSGMPEKSTVTMLPVMKAPLKDSLRVSETIFPPAPVPRVRTVVALAEASTPTLMPPITVAELGPSIRIKSSVPAVTSRVTVTGSICAADIQHHALDEQVWPAPVVGSIMMVPLPSLSSSSSAIPVTVALVSPVTVTPPSSVVVLK